MTESRNRLDEELRRLRKGRGIRTGEIGLLKGPGLRELCEIVDSDDLPTTRGKVETALDKLAAQIPEDLGLVFRASFALAQEARHRFLSDRLRWAGGRLDRDQRTIRRYAEEALRYVIDQALVSEPAPLPVSAPVPNQSRGWYVESLNALYRLDRPGVEAIEERTIVSTVDGLREVIAAISLPSQSAPEAGHPESGDVEADVLYGGRIVAQDRQGLSHFRWTVALPEALGVDDHARFAMRYSIPPGRSMSPHYILYPLHPCRRFQVAIRFAPTRVPAAVRRFSQAPHRLVHDLDARPMALLDDDVMGGEPVEPDRFGELHVEFLDLEPGYGYGVAWLVG